MWTPKDVLLKKNLNTALQAAEAWKALVARVDKLEKAAPTYATKEDLKAYVKTSDANGSQDGYVKKSELAAEGTGSYTKNDTDAKFVTKEEAKAEHTGFVTKDELSSKESALNEAISGKQAAGNYITEENLDEKVKLLDLSQKYETPESAQGKANAALDSAKKYAEQLRDALVGGASGAYDTLKELEDLFKANDSTVAAINALLAKKPGKFVATIGDGAQKEITVNHNLNSTDVVVNLYQVSDNNMVFSNVVVVDENNVKVVFDEDEAAPGSNAVKVVVIG